MQVFYFEMTDTYGGELNYCWLKRFKITAKNLKGALIKLSRETGFNFRNNGLYYKAKTACIGAYELEFFEPEHNQYWLEKAKEI
jgi:hypothetical protein